MKPKRKMCSPHFLGGQHSHTFITTVLYVFPEHLLEVCVNVGIGSGLAVVTVSQWDGRLNNR